MKYEIDYGFGYADLYTPSDKPIERFYELASQCFGIRKSILNPSVCSVSDEKPPYMLVGEYERLEHDGDVIVWDESGRKIKSEFDF